MAKSNSIITTEVLPGAIRFVVKGAGDMTLELAKVSDACKAHAAVHGFVQRISDAAAISRDKTTGASASPADKFTAMRRLIDHYETGTTEWTRVAEGGPQGGMLFEALCEMYGHMKAPSEIRAWLDGLSAKEQTALREDDEVAPVIARIKAAKQAAIPPEARVDTKGMLAGLKAPTTPTEEIPAA